MFRSVKSKLCLNFRTFGMASYFEEERFFLGQKSNHMVTVTPFLGKLKVHIRQFYVNEKGEKKPGKNGIVLDLEEFEALVKVVPKVQDSIARYELKDTGIPSSPFEPDLPVLDLDTVFLPSPPSQEPIPIIRNKELLDSQPKFPSSPPLFTEPSLENELNDLDLYFYMPGERRKRTNEASKKSNKKAKIGSNKTSGIFVGYAKLPSDMKEEQKKEKKIFKKKECINEVASVESMKEVERKLWLTHYDMLCEKLNEVVTEKCTGCQMNEPNQLGHEFCLLASVEEQVNTCFGEVYKRVIWDDVLDNWYKKVLEMPVALNPETLAVFRETLNPKDVTYKNRLKKWMIESPTVGL